MPTTYAIPNGATVFAATTYSGNNTSQSVSNGGNNPTAVTFKPDLVWIKNSGTTDWNQLTDSVRGTGKGLYSNSTSGEDTNNVHGYMNAFNSNGFGVTTGSTDATTTNATSNNYISWQWQAGQGTTSSNTAGSITSQVSANTTAGFSVVTWTGNFTAGATIGHGLGVAPSMILVFRISTGGNDHSVYHSSVGATKSLFLNSTAGTNTDAGYWNNTAPTSSVITLGQSNYTNPSSGTMVAYCWAEVAGYSKAFSYVGNSSSDGAFVYLGFRPRYILHKNTASSQWMIWDTSRSPYNVLTNAELLANSPAAQGSGSWGTEIDILSNGFKFRGSDNANFNYSGNTYVGFAFAENPFKYANAR